LFLSNDLLERMDPSLGALIFKTVYSQQSLRPKIILHPLIRAQISWWLG